MSISHVHRLSSATPALARVGARNAADMTLQSAFSNVLASADAGGGVASAASVAPVASATAAPASVAAGGATADKVMPSAADLRAFYATGPTDAQVAAKAKSLGLNAAQMVQAEVTGQGCVMSNVNSAVLESMYVDAANRLGENIGGGAHGAWTSYFSPTLGRAITKSEIQDFFSKNPSQSQIFQKASELGLGVGAVNNMMVGIGLTPPDAAASSYYQMSHSLYMGKDGYSADAAGHIVAGGGNNYAWSGDTNSGKWVLKTGAQTPV